MTEVYKKQSTQLEVVLGKYGFNVTKLAFATSYRQQVHLASGKMSKGAEPKFLYKMCLSMKLEELQSMVDVLDKCRKEQTNYHEFGEYTDYKGQVNRLILKTSDYGGLVGLKLQRVSTPDEFSDDDPLESCDPDPTNTDNMIISGSVVDWNECFEKFYISKNEDWKGLARKLRDFCNTLQELWSDDVALTLPTPPPSTPVTPTSVIPTITVENRVVSTPKTSWTVTSTDRQLPSSDPTTTTTCSPVVKDKKRKAPQTTSAVVKDKKLPKKPKKSKTIEVVSEEGESEVRDVLPSFPFTNIGKNLEHIKVILF